MHQGQDGRLWGIVLAAGEGTRVRAFLRRLRGGSGIKQFCAVIGQRSMLEHTLARTERLIPRERILVVVSTDHRDEAAAQLAHWPAENVIFQPLNRDTGPGILLPLAHISHREPAATVAIFPSDHFILDEDQFLRSVQTAVTELQQFQSELILLGMTPKDIDDGYGWIEPGDTEDRRQTRAVHRFWEKPSLLKAYALLRRGALWNTFVGVAKARTIWEMTRQAAPDLYRDFADLRESLKSPHVHKGIESLYQTLRPVNFSTGICEVLPSRLRVLPVPEVGWSDWGSVARIVATVQQLEKMETFARRFVQLSSPADRELPTSDA
jgi:mannose-1-phosphate guanylyltransferase